MAYLPVLYWDKATNAWQPKNPKEVPANLDIKRLPRPPFEALETVRFTWDGFRARGVISQIWLGGDKYQEGQEAAAYEANYYNPFKLCFVLRVDSGHSTRAILGEITTPYPEKETWLKKFEPVKL